MTLDQFQTLRVSPSFQDAATPPKPRRKKPAPFSLRLSAKERAKLEAMAGGQPLGRYVRKRLFGDQTEPRRVQRRPQISDQLASQLLAGLGESRLSSNLNQLAKHANIGSLEVSPEVEQQLQEAYEAILAMREALMTALGLRTGGRS